MKMVKSLTKANAGKYGIELRPDLDFTDDGSRFRGFSYKGMPMTQCVYQGTCYLCIRVDYLDHDFTYNEWAETEEYELCDAFNGVSEFDIEQLIEYLERVIAKVEAMNTAAQAEELNMTPVLNKMDEEICYAKDVIDNFKANFKWYDAGMYDIRRLTDYLKSSERQIAALETRRTQIDRFSLRQKKDMIETLNKFGYVVIRKDDFYLKSMLEALNK